MSSGSGSGSSQCETKNTVKGKSQYSENLKGYIDSTNT